MRPFLLFMGILLGVLGGKGQEPVRLLSWEKLEAQTDSLMQVEAFGQVDSLWLAREQSERKAGNTPAVIHCLQRRARLRNYDLSNQSKEPLLREAWALAQAQLRPADSDWGEVAQQLGEFMLTYARFDSAAYFLHQARHAYRLQQEQWENYAYSGVMLAMVAYYQQQPFQAEAMLLQTLDTAALFLPPQSDAFPLVFDWLGLLANERGDYDQAIHIAKKALDHTLKRDKPLDWESLGYLAVRYNALANLLSDKGDHLAALEYLREAKRLILESPVRDSAQWTYVLLNEGMQHWEMGNTEAAFQLWKRTEQTLLRQNRLASTPTKVLYFNKMATYYQSRKNWKKSLEMLDEAALFQAKDPKYQDLTLQKRSHTLIQMGKETEGLACLQRAIDLSQELYPRQNLQTIGHYRQLGDYHKKEGRNKAALQAYQQALFHLCPDASWQSPIANLKAYQVQDRLTYLSILSRKAPLLERMAAEQQGGDLLEWAHQTYTEASRQIDSLQAAYKRSGSKWRMAQMALPVYEGLIRIALDEFEATGNQQAFERALGFAEKNKAMVLREALQDLRAREFAGIPAEILSREKDLRLDLAFYRKKLFDEQQQAKADSLKLTLWQGRIFKLQTQFDKLLDTLERSYPAYFALKYGSAPLRLEPLLAAAKAAREQWVVYFWGEQSLFGLSLSERGPEAFSLDIDSSLIGDIRQLNSLLRTRPRDLSPAQRQESAQAYGQLAHRLFERLLAPCWAGPQQGSLRIIPDGLLHSLPFSALLTAEPADARNFGELPFLLRQQAVSYEYAIHFLTQEDKPRPVQAGWLGFAPSYGDSAQAWLPLRFNQREVQELRSKMGGEAWLGQEATEARFKAAASRHAMLHLAMHAFLNEENPLYSGMVFNLPADSLEDNLLHVYELYNLPLQAELVVLSACNSGAGKLVGGEGVLSLARAFRYAGCPSTIMSLWTADDRSSLKLMNYTYDQLEQDLPKDQALHQAKLSYLQSSPRAHPYYWAGYVFAGDNGKLQWTPGFSLSYLLGDLLLLLALSGWFWWKKGKVI